MKIGTTGMLLTALLLSVNTIGFAQRGCGNGYGRTTGEAKSSEHFCNNIPDLSADQQTKINKLRTAHWKDIQIDKNLLGEKQARLQTLRSADNVEMNAVNSIIDEIGTIQTKMQKKREQHFQDVRKVLTADQKVVFDNFKLGRGQGMNFGKGCGHGCGKGYGNGCCGRNR